MTWDAYLEDAAMTSSDRYLQRVARDNQMVITVEGLQGGNMTWLGKEHTPDFQAGWWDADLDLDPEYELAFDVNAYADGLVPPSEQYCDGYTARWFTSIPGDVITCGLRTDLPRKQRVHDYVSLGLDFKNKGEAGIVQVIVFACTVCGRDWRE